jgi:hypothetical protein
MLRWLSAALTVAIHAQADSHGPKDSERTRFQLLNSHRWAESTMVATAAHGTHECRELCRVTQGCVSAVITKESPQNCSIVHGTYESPAYDPRYETWILFHGFSPCLLRRGFRANHPGCDPSATPMDFAAMDAEPLNGPAEAFNGFGVRLVHLKDGDIVAAELLRVDYQLSLPRTARPRPRCGSHVRAHLRSGRLASMAKDSSAVATSNQHCTALAQNAHRVWALPLQPMRSAGTRI